MKTFTALRTSSKQYSLGITWCQIWKWKRLPHKYTIGYALQNTLIYSLSFLTITHVYLDLTWIPRFCCVHANRTPETNCQNVLIPDSFRSGHTSFEMNNSSPWTWPWLLSFISIGVTSIYITLNACLIRLQRRPARTDGSAGAVWHSATTARNRTGNCWYGAAASLSERLATNGRREGRPMSVSRVSRMLVQERRVNHWQVPGKRFLGGRGNPFYMERGLLAQRRRCWTGGSVDDPLNEDVLRSVGWTLTYQELDCV